MTDEEDLFFQNFKKKRESKNISVDDMANDTKIQKHYINAIEEGDFAELPPVYIKLFLKSYCKYIGFDVNKTLNQYNNYISGKKITTRINKTPRFIENKKKVIDSLNVNSDSKIINNSYFIQPQTVFSFLFALLIIIISWLTISNISTKNYEKNKIVHNGKKISWDDINSLSEIDSQYIEINKLKLDNIFKYEVLAKSNKIIFKIDNGQRAGNLILNLNDQGQEIFKENIEFGVDHGAIDLFINGEKIRFKHNDRIIKGYLEKKSTDNKDQLTIKYLK